MEIDSLHEPTAELLHRAFLVQRVSLRQSVIAHSDQFLGSIRAANRRSHKTLYSILFKLDLNFCIEFSEKKSDRVLKGGMDGERASTFFPRER